MPTGLASKNRGRLYILELTHEEVDLLRDVMIHHHWGPDSEKNARWLGNLGSLLSQALVADEGTALDRVWAGKGAVFITPLPPEDL